jgi:predicted nucleic acid-binding protein
MIVADASVVTEALLRAGPASDRIADERLFSPMLIDVEVLNGLRKAVLRRIISPERAETALQDFADTYIVRFQMQQLVGRAWELRDNVTPYDAMYVALAEWFEIPLVTTDAKLAGAPGVKVSVEVLPVG